MSSHYPIFSPELNLKPINHQSKKIVLQFNQDNIDSNNLSNYKLINKTNLALPIFYIDDQEFVLIKHLSNLWNYPSSYQLIQTFLKNGGFNKNQILKSNSIINEKLISLNFINSNEKDINLFYISFPLLYSKIENKDVFYFNSIAENTLVKDSDINNIGPSLNHHDNNDDNSNNKIKENEEDEADNLEEDNIDNDEDDEEIAHGYDDDDDEEDDDVEDDEYEDKVTKKHKHHLHKHKQAFDPKMGSDDKISISQIFPQYGLVNSNTQLNHGSFNSLNVLTKLNFYKNLPSSAHKFLPNVKLSFAERELIHNNNNFSDIHIEENKPADTSNRKRSFRKPLARARKHHIHVDPNSIDLSESVIPGQGYIPEFSINNYCKVPNYYVTSNHQTLPQSFNTKKLNHTSNSSFLFNNDGIKMSKNIQQLVFSNDNDNYYHSKYYYTKSYRGPGSGNYKDGAMMNKINKIHLTNDKKLKHKKNLSNSERYNKSLKGLVHDKFNKNFVENLLNEQRKYTEDYSNLEMLHNNLQFNLLINTFREISEDTWNNYFKFKLIDFEQLKALQQEIHETELRKQAMDDHTKWLEEEKKRQDRLQLVFEEERKKFEQLQQDFILKQKELEEERRRRQLEASFDDSFTGGVEEEEKKNNEKYKKLQLDFEKRRDDLKSKFEIKRRNLINPLPAPKPIETPQLDIVSKFSSPADYTDIIRHLPIELRSVNQDNKDDSPAIKKPIRYITTYPEESNPEFLTRIEVIKLPNANSIGWDNLRKFKSNPEN
ncbi:unnamed protein product [Candida verbasci]|uniref:Uncharacterized protein n=1 Tax=Candida verbasci TaxID=1227364 RepID=A0A9W4TT22_9ASCO|nr:unnamed protein product [Candida verbasci]